MKKIGLAIIALLFVGAASAQMQITKVEEPTLVCKTWNGWNKLYKHQVNGEYSYYFILASDNRYDRIYHIDLGSKKEAIETIHFLLDNYKPGADFHATEVTGETFYVFAVNMLGDKHYTIKKDGYGGYASIRLNELKKYATALYAE